ncbi:MAG TPA: hypothetical protein VN239_02020 [Nitrososphaera sp.]|nr:hypothetical protein [Nitrososphaera sp.]
MDSLNGDDVVSAGDGNDDTLGASGDDVLTGDKGNDLLVQMMETIE